jgi:chemotaxis regulatin CheY-phosphate phosphatase CheZ
MENSWTYKDYKIKEGLKPGAKHFQYFYVVSEGDEKKCNYCVWIEDKALSRFDQAKDFNKIVSSRKAEWNKWVKGKIDADDFRSLVLKFDEKGQKEIDLAEMEKHLSMK